MHKPHSFRNFDYDRTKSVNGYLGLLDFDKPSFEDLVRGQTLTGKTIGYPGWNLIYFLAVTSIRPRSTNYILETGTNIGLTTIVLAQALKDIGSSGKVISFEIDESNVSAARQHVKNAGLEDYVEIVLGDAIEEIRNYNWTGKQIEFAFLDACHEFEPVMKEYEWVIQNIKEDGLIVLDNTYKIAEEHEDPRVNGLLQVLERIGEVNMINLPFVSWYTPGLAIIQKTPNLSQSHD